MFAKPQNSIELKLDKGELGSGLEQYLKEYLLISASLNKVYIHVVIFKKF